MNILINCIIEKIQIPCVFGHFIHRIAQLDLTLCKHVKQSSYSSEITLNQPVYMSPAAVNFRPKGEV